MNKILVAIDGATHSEKTLKSAARIAQKNRGELIILYTCSQDAPSQNQLEFAEKSLGRKFRNLVTGKELPTFSVLDDDGEKSISQYMQAREQLCQSYGSDVLQRALATVKEAGAGRARTRMERGEVVKTILDVASNEVADTIVIGNCHKSKLARVFSGCIANDVLKRANCTAIVVD